MSEPEYDYADLVLAIERAVGQVLPSRDSAPAGSLENHVAYVVPHLKTLHRVLHQILPKPNKGLWERGLGLDHFLLSYFCIMHQNQQLALQQQQQQLQQQRQQHSSVSQEAVLRGRAGYSTEVDGDERDRNPTQFSRL